jgi:two-component system, NtrC family, sensor kinase
MLNFLLLLLLNVAPAQLPVQKDLLVASDSLFVNNVINLGAREGWRFHPGDDMQWADPGFDDSDWMLLKPSGLFDPIPDSLWQGYGWFRYRFAADSTIYNKIRYLYFFTWGAADVFLDGQPVKSYGQFSTDPGGEIRNMPYGKFFPTVVLTPNDSHVLAVRFSYHQGPLYKKFLGKHSLYFGFGTGLANDAPNQQIQNYRDSAFRVAYISSAMLLVIFLLHGFLFLLFRAECSNLYIAIVSALLFAHSILAFSTAFFGLDRLQYFLVSQLPFVLLLAAAFSFFPLTLSSMFNQKPKLVYKLLFLFIPVLTIASFVFNIEGLYLMAGFAFVIIFFSVMILSQALRQKEKGVWFVAAGFMGSLLSSLAAVIYESVFGSSRWEILSLFINLVYVSLPLGMTLFMAYRFYNLFTGLEHKVAERTHDLKKSLDDLHATQSQLIHAEKMASLGELTAGIAHEIQNPLNFVNNFAEVSGEMIDEMQEELEEGSRQSADGSRQLGEEKLELVKEIAMDIKQNLEKITHHGKRADAIVKGMLQHSRTNTGQKELTDINALVDEYLRLSYHGLRAKDKSFNASFETHFDPKLPKVEVIPQDIGRVLLNLMNNAFYACAERQKNLTGFQNLTGLNDEYKPTVAITTTRFEGNGANITI